MNSNMPPEVKAYYESGRKKILSVIPHEDFTLSISFDNGETRIYNMDSTLSGNVFKTFRDYNRFKDVYVDENGCIAWDIDPNVDSSIHWNNHIDLCPDSCYIYSIPVEVTNE